MCHAGTEGNRVSFARPDQWLADWPGLAPVHEAAQRVIPAYLRVFGPATPARFDAWLTRGASKKADLRSWFAELGERLVTVEIDGEPGLLLADDVDGLAAISSTQAVRLLPAFDQYLLGPGTKGARLSL